jgi:hypothetical protein
MHGIGKSKAFQVEKSTSAPKEATISLGLDESGSSRRLHRLSFAGS